MRFYLVCVPLVCLGIPLFTECDPGPNRYTGYASPSVRATQLGEVEVAAARRGCVGCRPVHAPNTWLSMKTAEPQPWPCPHPI
jgi:hypothetical protein